MSIDNLITRLTYTCTQHVHWLNLSWHIHMASNDWLYHKRRNFRWGLIFIGRWHPWKLNPRNLYTQRISNSNYSGLLSPTKINLLEHLTRKILWLRNLLRLRYSVNGVCRNKGWEREGDSRDCDLTKFWRWWGRWWHCWCTSYPFPQQGIYFLINKFTIAGGTRWLLSRFFAYSP